MEEIRLIEPTMEYADDIMLFRKEMMEANDNDKDSFSGCGGLEKCQTAEEWLQRIDAHQRRNDGKVPSNTYLAVRLRDKKIVGIIDLRHHINHPVLSLWGGHIGYSVRPNERRKGYAKELLRLTLQICKEKNLDRVMITCSRENIASEKTIIANGGIYEKEVLVDGEYIKRYWITIS